MYTISRNGQIIATIEADGYRMDLTGKNPVVVFHKGDQEGVLEDNDGHCTPYWGGHKKRHHEGRRERERGDERQRRDLERQHQKRNEQPNYRQKDDGKKGH